jgi:hypothetical protein
VPVTTPVTGFGVPTGWAGTIGAEFVAAAVAMAANAC